MSNAPENVEVAFREMDGEPRCCLFWEVRHGDISIDCNLEGEDWRGHTSRYGELARLDSQGVADNVFIDWPGTRAFALREIEKHLAEAE